ncbi:MAG TPA: UDP-glucose 4-epimerase GalE [Burkholderiales bacterium]|nr:UDP-glucose 4-epimerase GalE [Burkholderiales bacterium]
MGRRVLVTGGLGYIGSHTCVALCAAGWQPTIVDNLSNAKLSVLSRLSELTGKAIDLYQADLRDAEEMKKIFEKQPCDAVIHFAGLKAVGESVAKPQLYYDNNVGGTRVLLDAMARHGVRRIVFSSSATVYGTPERLPIPEDHRLRPESPYGENKAEIERLLAASALQTAALRYFNPIGAHASGRIGEDPRGIPNNLLPYVAQVAVGQRPNLVVHGNDYATPDGTGVRDYIHVMDLAQGHLAALAFLAGGSESITVNLGTGRGYSVLEVVQAFERASGRPVPYEIGPRRPGDVASCYADASLAARKLGWRAHAGLDEMCADAWRWQSGNPRGYPD